MATALPATQRQAFFIVNFGAPRPAFLNPWFHARLAQGVERAIYARRGDVVPDLPWRPWYRHGGALTRIGAPCAHPLAAHAIAAYAADLRALGV